MERKDEMLLMGYSVDILPHFPFFEVLPFDDALLLLIMSPIIVLHNEATQGFFNPPRFEGMSLLLHTHPHVSM